MPIYLGVKGDKLNPSPSYIGGKWEYNFKWKPPEENTIDFRVKIVKQGKKDKITTITENGKVIQCKEIELYVDYKIYSSFRLPIKIFFFDNISN